MEYCMEAKALKSSLRRELAMKSTQQALFEDFLCLNANNGVVSTEDFSVDCFFDFSNGELKDGHSQEQDEEEEEEEEEKDFLSVSSQDPVDDDNNSNSCAFSDSLLPSELSLPVPVDDLADLEWVSHFVDDSLSEISLLYPVCKEKTESHAMNQLELESKLVLTTAACHFPAWIPSKARTKRPRPTARTWSVGSPLTESSSSSTSSPCSTPCLVYTNTDETIDLLHNLSEPPMKKPKKKPAVQTGEVMGSTQFQRRCSHCQVQKTPQWRTGPLGAKTLCNACGVRYKSGRLYPEYRPACSPTFSGEIHSNSHRKVLEIRRRKEMAGPEPGLKHMVPSF